MPRSSSRRTFSKEFKLQILSELDAGIWVAEKPRVSITFILRRSGCGSARCGSTVNDHSREMAVHTATKRRSRSSSALSDKQRLRSHF